jgi:SpoIIAA-like
MTRRSSRSRCARRFAAPGAVRLLIRLDMFGGANLGESFDSPTSWLSDDEGVSRIAIVGRREWKVSVLMLITQPLRQLPIKCFETEAAARRWLLDTPAPAHATHV